MGLVMLMDEAEKDPVSYPYQFSLTGTADEVVTGIASGKLQAAAVPCNLASVLFNKTEGKIRLAAINTLGVLYIVEKNDPISSIQDLKGKTIFSTGKGTTPEYVLNYLLQQNGLDPEKDLTIEYKSESAEIAALFQSESNLIAVLPQPYVTIVQMQNENVKTALSFTDEWDKVTPDSKLITGCVILSEKWVTESPEMVDTFLENYQTSTEFVNKDPSAAAELIARYGIVPKAAIAEKAIPFSNITFITGDLLKEYAQGYLNVLHQADPKSVGGKLPDENFYYFTKQNH